MKVFISYRRSDSADITARIHDHLELFFGDDVIFRDIDRMQGGMNFLQRLENELGECELGIVIIASTWVSCLVEGKRRLLQDDDPVRLEVRTLLNLRKTIIPVLIGDVRMPGYLELPPDLAPLAPIQAIRVDTTYDFQRGVLELVKRIHAMTTIAYEDYPTLLLQCRHTGLVTIRGNFLDDITARQELRTARDVLVVQNDGRSWIDTNREILQARLSNAGQRTRVLLYHPRSAFLKTLVAKNKKGLDRQISEIRGSFEILAAAKVHADNFEIRAHSGFNPYSLVLTEDHAFMYPYLYNESGALPMLKFSAGPSQSLYYILRADAEQLFLASPPLTIGDFPASS